MQFHQLGFLRQLLKIASHSYLPNKVVACGFEGGLFLLNNKPQIEGQATAYVCENFICKSPVTSPKDLSDRMI